MGERASSRRGRQQRVGCHPPRGSPPPPLPLPPARASTPRRWARTRTRPSSSLRRWSSLPPQSPTFSRAWSRRSCVGAPRGYRMQVVTASPTWRPPATIPRPCCTSPWPAYRCAAGRGEGGACSGKARGVVELLARPCPPCVTAPPPPPFPPPLLRSQAEHGAAVSPEVLQQTFAQYGGVRRVVVFARPEGGVLAWVQLQDVAAASAVRACVCGGGGSWEGVRACHSGVGVRCGLHATHI